MKLALICNYVLFSDLKLKKTKQSTVQNNDNIYVNKKYFFLLT